MTANATGRVPVNNLSAKLQTTGFQAKIKSVAQFFCAFAVFRLRRGKTHPAQGVQEHFPACNGLILRRGGYFFRVIRIFRHFFQLCGQIFEHFALGQILFRDAGGGKHLLQEPGLDSVVDAGSAAPVFGLDFRGAFFLELFFQFRIPFRKRVPIVIAILFDQGLGLFAKRRKDDLKLCRYFETDRSAGMGPEFCEQGKEPGGLGIFVSSAVGHERDCLTA